MDIKILGPARQGANRSMVKSTIKTNTLNNVLFNCSVTAMAFL